MIEPLICVLDRVATQWPSLSFEGHITPFKAVSLRRPFGLISRTIAPSVSIWAESPRGASLRSPSRLAMSAPFFVLAVGTSKTESSFSIELIAHSVSPVGLGMLSRSTRTLVRYSVSISKRATAVEVTSCLAFVPNMQELSVLHDVVLAFEPHLARGVGGVQGPMGLVILVAHDLRADKALGDVGVDRARRFHRARAPFQRPGARLVFSRGEESDEPHRVVNRADHSCARRLRKPEAGKKLRLVGSVELGDL